MLPGPRNVQASERTSGWLDDVDRKRPRPGRHSAVIGHQALQVVPELEGGGQMDGIHGAQLPRSKPSCRPECGAGWEDEGYRVQRVLDQLVIDPEPGSCSEGLRV